VVTVSRGGHAFQGDSRASIYFKDKPVHKETTRALIQTIFSNNDNQLFLLLGPERSLFDYHPFHLKILKILGLWSQEQLIT